MVQYRYNEAGDLSAVTDALGQTTFFHYDKHLMVKMTDRNGYSFHWRYAYYGNGMMSKVVRPDGKEVIFTYDSLGRRIEKHFDGIVHCYVWDGNTILHEWEAESGFAGESKDLGDGDSEIGQSRVNSEKSGQEPDPSSLITWVFEDGTFHPAAKITSEGHYSIVTDHLGTPVKMYDEHGEQVWSCELDIYGNVRRFILKGDHNACPFRYPGQYEDVETGLYTTVSAITRHMKACTHSRIRLDWLEASVCMGMWMIRLFGWTCLGLRRINDRRKRNKLVVVMVAG
ncbi:hypothetical protein EIM92_11405 [Paenibacillus lentus]|uniref:RHS protein conserved region domain-containing protein n=1 Tax=Paenibacillus lentus TaxID=1338368 RepID=A0A3Q8S4U0_9BACL|nr:hypothetical protein EIM92_11405 [Paenibacillus lentus]